MKSMKKDISLYNVLNRILAELNEQVVEHGERVAYMYLKLAQYRGLPDDQKMENMMLACYAHDIGAYKTEKFLNLLNFDVSGTSEHCIYGCLFMKHFSPIGQDAEVLLYHHTAYADVNFDDCPMAEDGVLIHLLDRIDVLGLLRDREGIMERIQSLSGINFNPGDVKDFALADLEYDIIEHLKDGSFRDEVRSYFDREERIERLIDPVIAMLAYEVDFKSEQTVVHSITTTLFADVLADRLGLGTKERKALRYAARVHDLGKIDVPQEIVEKPGRLTPDEYAEMKNHVLYTEKIIEGILPEQVVRIASRHHERLDGSGYPLGLTVEELGLEDRIIQVSDVISALLQKRSYKEIMGKEQVLNILGEEAEGGRLDSEIIRIFAGDYDEIVKTVWNLAAGTICMYENLHREYKMYLDRYSELMNIENGEFGLFTGII